MPLWIFYTVWKLITGKGLWAPSIERWYETLENLVQKAFLTCKRCSCRPTSNEGRRNSDTTDTQKNEESKTKTPQTRQPENPKPITRYETTSINGISQVVLQQILQDKEDEIKRIRAEKGNNQANTSTASCTICLEEFSEDRHKIAFHPCGHCCCHICAPQIQSCHECRERIQNKVRLFE